MQSILTLLKAEATQLTPDTEIKQKNIVDRIAHLSRLIRMQDGGPYLQNYAQRHEIDDLMLRVKGFTYKESQLLCTAGYRWFVSYNLLKQFQYAGSFYTDDRCNVGNGYHKLIYKGDIPAFILDRIDELEQIATRNRDVFLGIWNFAIVSMNPIPLEKRELKPIDPLMLGFMNCYERNADIECERDKYNIVDIHAGRNQDEKHISAVVVGIWNGEKEVAIL